MIHPVAESRSFFSLMPGVMEPDLSLGFETNLQTSFTYSYKAIISRSNRNGIDPAIGFSFSGGGGSPAGPVNW